MVRRRVVENDDFVYCFDCNYLFGRDISESISLVPTPHQWVAVMRPKAVCKPPIKPKEEVG